MQPTKEDIKSWLKETGRTREWLAKQCGNVTKRTVDNWLSSPATIPDASLAIIERLIVDDVKHRLLEIQPQQNIVIQVDVDTFERWSRAALKHGEILTEYAIRTIEEAAAADMANQKETSHTNKIQRLPLAAEEGTKYKSKAR